MNLEKISIRFKSIDYNILTLNLKTVNVESNVSAIRVEWTAELEQDIYAYPGIDAELELTNILQEELSRQMQQYKFQ